MVSCLWKDTCRYRRRIKTLHYANGSKYTQLKNYVFPRGDIWMDVWDWSTPWLPKIDKRAIKADVKTL
jgi:hypothetical protein